jgi:hypothetical protein
LPDLLYATLGFEMEDGLKKASRTANNEYE